MQSYGGSDQAAFEGGGGNLSKSGGLKGSQKFEAGLLNEPIDLNTPGSDKFISEDKKLTEDMVDVVYNEFHDNITCSYDSYDGKGKKECQMSLVTFDDKDADFSCSRTEC